MQQVIFNQEQSSFDVSTGALTVGLAMVGPTLIAWGTEDQKSRYLGPMQRGEEVWCQLFSEPSAGSDLAGLITPRRTRRCRMGRQWTKGLDLAGPTQSVGHPLSPN